MPLYEYHCNTCGENFEKMVRFSEQEQEQAPECPQCHSRDTRKRISLFASRGFSSSSLAAGESGSACSAPSSSAFR